ncbi:hypothetical protein [Curtobacterium sp. VKM Ac-1393]|uniref:hypothetical protein n=1 Tax=Curtobacterium sp. VKM Ac-1393 TaxID=2783814 RepID=UPI00188A1A4F|nr:hypothetical protein [Curtobacterium sp. VKM Ac-1393]MBF4609048.1 hypothetical protein [Curtobacterium sp. VKM Ac-1393]
MHITTRAAKSGTLVIVVAGLVTAVLHGLPEPADIAVAPTVEQNSTAWAMPLDAYVAPGSSKTAYAEDLVTQPCLRKAGIDGPPPWATAAGLQAESDADDSAARANPSPALATTRPLTAALAETRGYHGPSTAGANAEGMKAWAFDPDRQAGFAALPQDVLSRCWAAARQRLGTGTGGSADAASELAQRLTYLAAVDARQDESVVTAAAGWRSCMAPSGVTDLPTGPEGMPTPSMRVSGRDGDEVVPFLPTVGKAEVAVAERDAACQDSSGYRKALYGAEWDRLLHVTVTDAAVLRKGSTRWAQVDARVDRAITRLAPEAPADAD